MSDAGAPTARRLRMVYYSLFGLLFVSFGLFALVLFVPRSYALWQAFNHIYLTLLVLNAWYVFALMCIGYRESKHRKPWGEEHKRLITVLVPCYNEKPELLAETLFSIFRCEGNKEIVIVDDGSVSESRYLIELIGMRPGVSVHRLPKNCGKREAIHYAVKHLVSPDSFCVVTIDSDTILDPKALVRIAAPLTDKRVGATTGDVLLLNEKQNLLTRMTATYYWMGLNIYKSAQSALGNVVCCSGCLSAYRTELLRDIVDEFHDQRFLGEKCTHSEDRHLTNLLLRRGYKVLFVEEAKSFTESPSTVRGFCRQQLRWKRGYVRESVYTLCYAWKNQKRLFLQILLWDLTATYFTFGLRLYLVMLIVLNPLFALLIILPLWLIMTFLRYMYVAVRSPKRLFGLLLYALFFEAILYWVNLYALFTVRNKRWVTR